MKKTSKSKQNKKIKKLLRVSFVVILIAIFGSVAIYGVARAGMGYYGENVTPSNYSLLNNIGEQIKLPKEDIKMFLKVKNPESLKNESDFYKDIQKDNYVVIYPSLAIIYDANSNQVLKTIILKE